MIKNHGAHGNLVPLLYRDMALSSLAHARRNDAEGMTHCGAALAELVKARGAVKGVDPSTSYQIEMATGEVEQVMSAIAARDGDKKAALAHRESAKKHVETVLAIDQDDPRATLRMKMLKTRVPAPGPKPASTRSVPDKEGA